MLIEVIFKGLLSAIDLSLTRKLAEGAKEIYFNAPEISSVKSSDEVIEIIQSNPYVDLAINTNSLKVDQIVVPKVFINLGRNNDEIEILFFFDLDDLAIGTPADNLNYLKNWTIQIQQKYNFSYFICQMDNANEEEYYFDSNGIGKLFIALVS